MRLTPVAISAAIVLATFSTASLAQRADKDIDARSLAMMTKGVERQQAGDLAGATDFYETSLAVDPRNRAAFIALAQVARAQGLPGKAIGLYREALILDPADVVALTGQGEALADKGALTLAKAKLADARKFCRTDCPQIAALDARLVEADAKKLVAAEAVTPKPVVSSAEVPANQP